MTTKPPTHLLNPTLLSLDAIVPYWRNPREITDEAVQAVAESLTKYGYQQPIIVDKKNVIITGHTRYAALRKLGVDEVMVLVSDLPAKQANEYRVVDNRTSEYTDWNDDLLLQELREFEAQALDFYFPDADLGLDVQDLGISDEEIATATAKVNSGLGAETADEVQMICSHCFQPFSISAEQLLRMADDYRTRRDATS